MNLHIAQRMHNIKPFIVMELLQRAQQLQAQGRDVIHMEIGEPDFATPPLVQAAAAKFLQQGDAKYTAAAGLPELRAAIAAYYRLHYGVAVDAGRIFITPGASGAFLLAFGSSLNPGQAVMMADPCYPCNANFVQLFNAETQLVAVGPATNYQLDAGLIAQNWRANTSGVLIASPANPTGSLLSNTALAAAIDQVQALGGCFYADEIYHGLDYAEPPATALASHDQVFVINSFSKFFGMTGWRIGWLIVPDSHVAVVERLAQNIFISTSSQAQYAALASFSAENMTELRRRRDEFKIRRDYLYENLLRLGFKITAKPEGAFYIYADCSTFSQNSYQFAKDLLEAEGVAVTPGTDFGYNGADKHIRFAYTASIPRMAEALTRLERFICR